MKKLVKIAFVAFVLMALVSGGKFNQTQKSSVDNNPNQVTLMDFDNSGDPEYLVAF